VLADTATAIQTQLHYDYALIPDEYRGAIMLSARRIKEKAERSKRDILEIGRELTETKAKLEHGQFGDWLSVEFGMSDRTAQRFMAVHETYGGKSDTVSFLNDSALYLLSGPTVPEAARQEVETQARDTGKSPTKAAVQAVIAKHKPTYTPLAPLTAAVRTWFDSYHDWLNRDATTVLQATRHANAPSRVDLEKALTEQGMTWQRQELVRIIDNLKIERTTGSSQPNPYAPRQVATFKADPADDPDSADVHIMQFAHVQPPAPSSPAPASTPPQPAGAAVAPLSPPVTPALPADLEGAGWALLRVSGVGNWYCLNRMQSKATATHEEPSEAIAEARAMSVTPWRDLVAGVATEPPATSGEVRGEDDSTRDGGAAMAEALLLRNLYRSVLASLERYRAIVPESDGEWGDSVATDLRAMIKALERSVPALA
jgi:hypothetical protein